MKHCLMWAGIDHHKAMLLWAAKYVDGLVSADERERWTEELFDLRKQTEDSRPVFWEPGASATARLPILQ